MLRKLFGRQRARNNHDDSAPWRCGRSDADDGTPVIVRHHTVCLRDGENREFTAMATEATGVPLFEGHVEQSYDLECVANPSEFPRCGAPTEQRYANFIYATQIAPRVMFAPAGHFCAECSSVVVDRELIQAGISSSQFQYRGVLGIDYGEGRDPDLFKTWNGENAVYVFDEDQTPLGIGTLNRGVYKGRTSTPPAKNKQQKRKKRKKASRHARRVNRDR